MVGGVRIPVTSKQRTQSIIIMSLFDLQLFTLHVASHLVGEETIRRALSSSNDESSKSRHLFSWRSPPLAPGNSDYDCNGVSDDDEKSSYIHVIDQNQHRHPQEQKEEDEESRNASLVFLEVIFDWHPIATPAILESMSTTTNKALTTRTITMHVNALLRMSQDGTGLCVGVAPSGKRTELVGGPLAADELCVTLQDLERHFEQISIDVTSTPEAVLATTFANALLAMHTHSPKGVPSPPQKTTAVENASLDRACVLKSSPGSGDMQAHIPLWYQDLQETATWIIRQPAQSTSPPTTTSIDLSISGVEASTLWIPAVAMSMWMRSLAPPTAAHMLTSTSAFTTGEPPRSAAKSMSTPPPTVEKQKQTKPAADLLTFFQEWRQTPVLPAADPLHYHAVKEKEDREALFLDKESPCASTTHNNLPAAAAGANSPVQQPKQKVVQIKRKHGFTRIPAKKKKTGKLKFAGVD